jgi:hypothetical protein
MCRRAGAVIYSYIYRKGMEVDQLPLPNVANTILFPIFIRNTKANIFQTTVPGIAKATLTSLLSVYDTSSSISLSTSTTNMSIGRGTKFGIAGL